MILNFQKQTKFEIKTKTNIKKMQDYLNIVTFILKI